MTEQTDQQTAVSEQLAAEIEALLVEQKGHDDAAERLSAEHDKLMVQIDKSRKLEKKIELEEKANKVHNALMRHISQGIRISEKLRVLRNPTEILRRMNDADKRAEAGERLKRVKEESKQRREEREAKPFQYKTHVPKATAREDGVPEPYLKENGAFKTGYDAKLKSHLVSAALGKQHPEALHRFTKAQAEKLLEKRGWQKYLDGAKARIEAEKVKAKKKAKK